MRVHAIQQAPFEGPGLIADWAAARGHELTTSLAATEEYPACNGVDFLVILGGPMDADDEVASPWLHAEKHYVVECIAAGRGVLGICLGAQILAEVLGGKIRRNDVKEIGWYSVEKTETGGFERLLNAWPDNFVAGQWHGDTFDLPGSLVPLLSSEACENQAFLFDRRVLGLQFHLEWSEASLRSLIEACGDELTGDGMWTMSANELMDEAPDRIAADRELLFSILDALAVEVDRLAAASAL
ncbi:MAG: type 1 glutamine amidotransferase [Coriobacteriia bacterium]|nr:type 1 glutamine amidotransferase [Coriobacteriia bacterium]